MEDEEAVDHQVYGPHRSSFDCQFDVKRIFAKAGALDVFARNQGVQPPPAARRRLRDAGPAGSSRQRVEYRLQYPETLIERDRRRH